MLTRIRTHLTYANVVSTFCLFALLGGGAFAATKLKKNSVGTKQLQANAVTGAKVNDNAITSSKIADGQVTTPDLADGSVSSAKIADGAVSGTKILDESITTNDIEGTDVTGAINLPAGAVGPNSCTSTDLDAAGAQIGDLPLLAFVGVTPAPGGLVFEPIKVTSPGHMALQICNPTPAPSPAGSGVGVRIITLR